jgi:hypothetical protein
MKKSAMNRINNHWAKGLVRIFLVLALLSPVGFGYSVYNDYSGRLKTEQLNPGNKKQGRVCHFHHWKEILTNKITNKTTFPFQLSFHERIVNNCRNNQQTTYLPVKDKTVRLILSTIISHTGIHDKMVCL